METFGLVLVGLGFLLSIVCSFWILILGFQESILWGIAMILFSPVSLIFVILHIGKTGVPLLYSLVGFAMMMFGSVLAGPALEQLAAGG